MARASREDLERHTLSLSSTFGHSQVGLSPSPCCGDTPSLPRHVAATHPLSLAMLPRHTLSPVLLNTPTNVRDGCAPKSRAPKSRAPKFRASKSRATLNSAPITVANLISVGYGPPSPAPSCALSSFLAPPSFSPPPSLHPAAAFHLGTDLCTARFLSLKKVSKESF